jgi:hypothetical protein
MINPVPPALKQPAASIAPANGPPMHGEQFKTGLSPIPLPGDSSQALHETPPQPGATQIAQRYAPKGMSPFSRVAFRRWGFL